jgi:hypothetical protein
MRAVRVGTALALVLLLCAASARAGFRDLRDGWLLGPASAAALLDGRSEPAAGWTWRAGVSRLHGLPGLELGELGLRGAGGVGRVDLAWQRLGGELWHEDRLVLLCGRGPVALIADARALGAGDRIAGRRLDLRCELELEPAAGWRLRLNTDPYTLVDGCSAPPWRAWCALEHRVAAWAAGLQLDRGLRGGTATRVGGLVVVGGGVGLGLLCGLENGELGLTTAWRRGRLLVRSSHLVHPVLGPTHRWQLALTAGGAGS